MNRALLNDMSRCSGVDCDIKKQCQRYLTMFLDHQNDLGRKGYTPRPHQSSLRDAAGHCEYFMEDR